MSHTPGPWRAENDDPTFLILGEDRVYIAEVGLPGVEMESNARLIAAAPDLLAALERCLAAEDSYFGMKSYVVDQGPYIREIDLADEQARAAIAKARA